MAYPTSSADSVAITSWAGTFYTALLAQVSDISVSLNVDNSSAEVTELGGVTAVHIAGIKSWSVSMSMLHKAPIAATPSVQMGTQGNVTASGGTTYVLHCNSLEFELSAPVFDITSFAATPPTWRAFRPGRVIGTFRYVCRVDSATGLADLPAEGDTLPTLTLKYGEGTVDDTISGSAVINSRRDNYTAGQLSTVEYAGVFTGNITEAGTDSLFTFDSGTTFKVPEWDAGVANATNLVLDTGPAENWDGDAFWTRIRVAATIGEPVSVDVDAQGTNALTSV